MAAMPGLARMVVTSPPYRMFARRVVLPWVLTDEHLSGEGLEIGAGCGVMCAELLAVFPALRMVATDVDPRMIQAARRRLWSFGDRAQVARADAAQLPFAGDRFDVVLAAAMLHHVAVWQDAVAEAVRVLRPGGRLIGYDPLDGPLTRLVHISEARSTTMLNHGELEARLQGLPVTGVRVERALRGMVIRFATTKIT